MEARYAWLCLAMGCGLGCCHRAGLGQPWREDPRCCLDDEEEDGELGCAGVLDAHQRRGDPDALPVGEGTLLVARMGDVG